MTDNRDEDDRSGDEPPAELAGARPWLVLTVGAPPRHETFLLVDALHRLGARSIERHGDRVAATFPPPRSVPALLEEARLVIRSSITVTDPALEWRWQEHETFADKWLREQAARRVSGRIIVAPVGSDVTAQGDDILILLLPSTAFGTAEHPTTRACLAMLEGSVAPGCRVADVGTGSGILAIAAARLGAERVLAVDADAHAVTAAQSNVTLNRVEEWVTVRQLDVRPDAAPLLGHNDVVVANLRAEIIVPLLPVFQAALAPSGDLVISGILGTERPRVLGDAERSGWVLREDMETEGWWTGRLMTR